MKEYIAAFGESWAYHCALSLARPDEQWDIAGTDGAALKRLFKLSPSPRYVFFLNYSHIVPEEITQAHECVNFHCTPLPYGRGGGPIEGMILRGHTETVITAHRMTSELDAGPIYGTRGPISLAGTKADIQQRFIAPVADLIRWIVENEPEPTPQEGEPTLFKRLPKAEYEAFWAGRA